MNLKESNKTQIGNSIRIRIKISVLQNYYGY